MRLIKETWYRIVLPGGRIFAVVAVQANDDPPEIEKAAPACRWMVGRLLSTVQEWCRRNGGMCLPLPGQT